MSDGPDRRSPLQEENAVPPGEVALVTEPAAPTPAQPWMTLTPAAYDLAEWISSPTTSPEMVDNFLEARADHLRHNRLHAG